MVVTKTINNLKQGPKEDKVAVASGIAVGVVAVLLVAWAFLFFQKIQKGDQQINFAGGAQDEFNFQDVKDAQQQLQNAYNTTADELRRIRDEAAEQQAAQNNTLVQPANEGSDPFNP